MTLWQPEWPSYCNIRTRYAEPDYRQAGSFHHPTRKQQHSCFSNFGIKPLSANCRPSKHFTRESTVSFWYFCILKLNFIRNLFYRFYSLLICYWFCVRKLLLILCPLILQFSTCFNYRKAIFRFRFQNCFCSTMFCCCKNCFL